MLSLSLADPAGFATFRGKETKNVVRITDDCSSFIHIPDVGTWKLEIFLPSRSPTKKDSKTRDLWGTGA
ncbi:unnamed protein product [Periconia digitata]|uniref:Uncharacterized protein n=1 Tax=Periconia digitata TaxID=1303443 RepID=A0A9W4UR31_9PLEO|nr:unnamed protein product [Periconia digitata]